MFVVVGFVCGFGFCWVLVFSTRQITFHLHTPSIESHLVIVLQKLQCISQNRVVIVRPPIKPRWLLLQRKEKQKRELNETPSLISIQVNLNSSISFLHQSHALVLRHEEHSQCANKPRDMLN